MRRTQIYLTREQRLVLEGRSRATGRTISELIRDAIDAAYTRVRTMTSESAAPAVSLACIAGDAPGFRYARIVGRAPTRPNRKIQQLPL